MDNWTDQNAPNRASRTWGQAALLRQVESQARGMAQMFARSSVSGFGLWAGIDTQRGYHHIPFFGGLLDSFRIPKFSYHLFASQRPPGVHVPGLEDGPMVFVASYWDEFSAPDVTVFSNCDRVRLFQDGRQVAEAGPDESPELPASIGANPMRAQAGIASALVAGTRQAGKIIVTARAFGLRPATLTFESMPGSAPAWEASASN